MAGTQLSADAPEGSWASSQATRRAMLANRRRDTVPEAALRSELHRRGLRFFKDRLVRAGEVRTHPDVLFPRAGVVVYVDGCFWHRCPLHATDPKSNADYWRPKLEANVSRDRRANAALSASGWRVLRFWEHEDVHECAEVVEAVVRKVRAADGSSAARRTTLGSG